ncbi:unnamed protein product [Phytomonas sp. Hart1]|nr:unnamed protein product [Phytomonas sp. Hart1]|eukprot:CCW67894.1 unnamed protein product [Phytomonas sp. isolate Hart1]
MVVSTVIEDLLRVFGGGVDVFELFDVAFRALKVFPGGAQFGLVRHGGIVGLRPDVGGDFAAKDRLIDPADVGLAGEIIRHGFIFIHPLPQEVRELKEGEKIPSLTPSTANCYTKG